MTTPADELPDEELSRAVALHGFEDKPLAIAHFSFSEPHSVIAAHSPGGRITPLVEFLPLPMRGAELLRSIASIDEQGPRLIGNFRKLFSDLAAEVDDFDPEVDIADSAALGWLFASASLLLGLSQAEAEEALLYESETVKLDTYLVEIAGHNFLDSRRMLRSLMSYRIAGVQNHVLARSIFISLGNFTGEVVRRLLSDFDAKAVLCLGDLFFANRILADSARSSMATLRVPIFLSSGPNLEDPLTQLEALLSFEGISIKARG